MSRADCELFHKLVRAQLAIIEGLSDCRLFVLACRHLLVIKAKRNEFMIFMSTVKCKYHSGFGLINGFVTNVIIRRLRLIHTDETCLRTTALQTVRGTKKKSALV